MGEKGQFATEYLIVTAFMMLALLGGVYFFFTNSPSSKVVHGQVERMGNTLIDTANDLYFIGKPSKTTSQILFPPGIKDIYVNQTAPKELVILYETRDGDFESIFLSRVTLAVNLNYVGRGQRDIVIEAKEGAVSLCIVENLCNCDGICQRPAENYTHCAADCCASEQPGSWPRPGGRTCRACNATNDESLSPFTCTNSSIAYAACDGHNNCDCNPDFQYTRPGCM